MISGSFGELKNLIATLQQTNKRLLPAASKAMASTVAAEYSKEFSQQRSPWGDQWVANMQGTRTGYRSGALASASPTLNGNVVRIRPPRYWSYFQAGAPARADGSQNPRGVLPFGPSKWDAPVESYFGGST